MVIIADVGNQLIPTKIGFAVAHFLVELNTSEFTQANQVTIGDFELSALFELHGDGAVFCVTVGREEGNIDYAASFFVIISCNSLWHDCDDTFLVDGVLYGEAIGIKVRKDFRSWYHVHQNVHLTLFTCLRISPSCRCRSHSPFYRLLQCIVSTSGAVFLGKCGSLACCLSPRCNLRIQGHRRTKVIHIAILDHAFTEDFGLVLHSGLHSKKFALGTCNRFYLGRVKGELIAGNETPHEPVLSWSNSLIRALRLWNIHRPCLALGNAR